MDASLSSKTIKYVMLIDKIDNNLEIWNPLENTKKKKEFFRPEFINHQYFTSEDYQNKKVILYNLDTYEVVKVFEGYSSSRKYNEKFFYINKIINKKEFLYKIDSETFKEEEIFKLDDWEYYEPLGEDYILRDYGESRYLCIYNLKSKKEDVLSMCIRSFFGINQNDFLIDCFDKVEIYRNLDKLCEFYKRKDSICFKLSEDSVFIGDSLGVNIFDMKTLSSRLWEPKNVNIADYSQFYEVANNIILITTSNEENFVIYDIKKDEVIYKAFNEKFIFSGRPPRIFLHNGFLLFATVKRILVYDIKNKKIASEIENSEMSSIYYVI